MNAVPVVSGRTPANQRQKPYRNQHDDNYAAKLARVTADIESGVIDRLTLAIGRDKYCCSDSLTRRLQIALVTSGHLERVGKRYRVAA